LPKFRVWNKLRKEWSLNYVISPEGVLLYQWADNIVDVENKENLEVCFSIGRKDKSGKEIYESDLVKYEGTFEVGIVERHGVGFRIREFNAKIQNGDCEIWSIDADFEIIGNIHENPELIENSKVEAK